jgi:hypothetical protein
VFVTLLDGSGRRGRSRSVCFAALKDKQRSREWTMDDDG